MYLPSRQWQERDIQVGGWVGVEHEEQGWHESVSEMLCFNRTEYMPNPQIIIKRGSPKGDQIWKGRPEIWESKSETTSVRKGNGA